MRMHCSETFIALLQTGLIYYAMLSHTFSVPRTCENDHVLSAYTDAALVQQRLAFNHISGKGAGPWSATVHRTFSEGIVTGA